MSTPPVNPDYILPQYLPPEGIHSNPQGSFTNKKATATPHDASFYKLRTPPDGMESSQEETIMQRVIKIGFTPITEREVTTPRESPRVICKPNFLPNDTTSYNAFSISPSLLHSFSSSLSSDEEAAEIQQQTTTITINSPYPEDAQMDSLGSIGEEIAKTKQSWIEPQRQTMPTTRHPTPHPRLLQIDSTSSSDESSPAISEDALESGINNLQL
ncbi:hypothetical protein [Endozoicomonas atrinae]|uniref:hypothetical protein n=1 Tax=Endozoicomonas atrinae TaxID=1333660 RepID=UPI000825F78E|nr:hypothetical protein [Endozoicomonas atrinae]